MQRARIAVIGGGPAGVATAWALSRRGENGLLILEKVEFANTHSSGRNAAMIRQLIDEPGAGPLARSSAQFSQSFLLNLKSTSTLGKSDLFGSARP
ncbi:MAG: FAD-binding oxidoreductase [Chrysiogenetes bacterium]|nr:FAD-binding oxidoreductase [Chrysiogenetes bacterium]